MKFLETSILASALTSGCAERGAVKGTLIPLPVVKVTLSKKKQAVKG